jgi:ring-1,2-phenylacetyl-CoA epoxidase subunit PaaE
MFKKLFGSKSQKKESSGGPRYYKLKVSKIEKETADAITIFFENPESGAIPYKPGQFLTLIIPVDGEKIRRSYSLCSVPVLHSQMAVTVKRVKDGKLSNYLNDSLKAGDTIDVMEPSGVFTTHFDQANDRNVYLVGGGSGITPLISILRSVLEYEPNSRVSLIYANRNLQSIIFKDKLEALEEEFQDRLKITHILEEAPEGWTGYRGMVNEEIFNEILDQGVEKGLEFFLCGPSPMMDKVVEILEGRGMDKKKIHRENFVSKSKNPLQNKTEEQQKKTGHDTYEVTVLCDGEEHKFEVSPEKTILETALDLDIDLPFSCQSGLCTACRGKLKSGKMELDESEGLSEQELKDGYVLTCVGHPVTPDVKIEIG